MKKQKPSIIIQKREMGWPGYHAFVRLNLHHKCSFVIDCDKEPKLTKKLSDKLIAMAKEEDRIEKHNSPLYFEREKFDDDYRSSMDDISRLLWEDAKRSDVIKCLESFCEYPAVNEILQRVLDLQAAKEEVRKIEAKKLPRLDRNIKKEDL